MTARRTIVLHTRLSGHMIRVDAARSGAHGVQVMTMGQLASRLAGGFLQPIDAELQCAVRQTPQIRSGCASARRRVGGIDDCFRLERRANADEQFDGVIRQSLVYARRKRDHPPPRPDVQQAAEGQSGCKHYSEFSSSSGGRNVPRQ